MAKAHLDDSASPGRLRRGGDPKVGHDAGSDGAPGVRCPPRDARLHAGMNNGPPTVGFPPNKPRDDQEAIYFLENVTGMGELEYLQPESRAFQKFTHDIVLLQKEISQKKIKEGEMALGAGVGSSTAEGTPEATSGGMDTSGLSHHTSSSSTSKIFKNMLSGWFCCSSSGVAVSNRLHHPHSVEGIKSTLSGFTETKGKDSACSKQRKSGKNGDTKEQPAELRSIEVFAKTNEGKSDCIPKISEEVIFMKAGEPHSFKDIEKRTPGDSCSLSLKMYSGIENFDACNESNSALDIHPPQEHVGNHQHQLKHFASAEASRITLPIVDKDATASPDRKSKCAESEKNDANNEKGVSPEPDFGVLPDFTRLNSASQVTLLQDVDNGKEIDVVSDGMKSSFMAHSKLTSKSSVHRENCDASDRTSSSLPLDNPDGSIEKTVKFHLSESLPSIDLVKSSTPRKEIPFDDTFNNSMHITESVSKRTDRSPPELMAIPIKGGQCNGREKSFPKLRSSNHSTRLRFLDTHHEYRPHTQREKIQQDSGDDGSRVASTGSGEKDSISFHRVSTRSMILSSSVRTTTGDSPQDYHHKEKYAKLRKQIIQNSRVHSVKSNFDPFRNSRRRMDANHRAFNYSSHNHTPQKVLINGGTICHTGEHDKWIKDLAKINRMNEKWHSRSRYLCPKETKLREKVYALDQKLHALYVSRANIMSNNNAVTAALMEDKSSVFSANSSQERTDAKLRSNVNEEKLPASAEPLSVCRGDGSEVKGQDDHKDAKWVHGHRTHTDSTIFTQRSFKDTYNSSYAKRYPNTLRVGQYSLHKDFPVKRIAGDFPKFMSQGDSPNAALKAHQPSPNNSTRSEFSNIPRDNDRILNHKAKCAPTTACSRSTVIIYTPTRSKEQTDDTSVVYESLGQPSILDDCGVAAQVSPSVLRDFDSDTLTRIRSPTHAGCTGSKSIQSSEAHTHTSRGDLSRVLFHGKKSKIKGCATNELSNESYLECLRAALRHEYYSGEFATLGVPDGARAQNYPHCDEKSSPNGNKSETGECRGGSTTRRSGSDSSEKGSVDLFTYLLAQSTLLSAIDPPPWRSSCSACAPPIAEADAACGLLLFKQLQRRGGGGVRGFRRPIPAALYAPPPHQSRGAEENAGKGEEPHTRTSRERMPKSREAIGGPPTGPPRRPFTPALSALRLYLRTHRRGRRAWRLRKRITRRAHRGRDLGIGKDEPVMSPPPPSLMADSDFTTISVVGGSEKRNAKSDFKPSGAAGCSGSGFRKESETQDQDAANTVAMRQDPIDNSQEYLLIYKSQLFQTPPGNVTGFNSDSTSSNEEDRDRCKLLE
ncbi:unnamed protein product [Phytomonas sp. Hart1]|nr:unnamed protein product [Phytomonas sp. Hart1]|eukprot:CCW69077.1 unnamed protein product [Phytomonas sp. isolate Hart1]